MAYLFMRLSISGNVRLNPGCSTTEPHPQPFLFLLGDRVSLSCPGLPGA